VGVKGTLPKKPVFDFEVDNVVGFVQRVTERFRNQDWGNVFLPLLLILGPAGFLIFLVRDRYYRRRGEETIKLIWS